MLRAPQKSNLQMWLFLQQTVLGGGDAYEDNDLSKLLQGPLGLALEGG